jgi:hypothetical protein
MRRPPAASDGGVQSTQWLFVLLALGTWFSRVLPLGQGSSQSNRSAKHKTVPAQ